MTLNEGDISLHDLELIADTLNTSDSTCLLKKVWSLKDEGGIGDNGDINEDNERGINDSNEDIERVTKTSRKDDLNNVSNNDFLEANTSDTVNGIGAIGDKIDLSKINDTLFNNTFNDTLFNGLFNDLSTGVNNLSTGVNGPRDSLNDNSEGDSLSNNGSNSEGGSLSNNVSNSEGGSLSNNVSNSEGDSLSNNGSNDSESVPNDGSNDSESVSNDGSFIRKFTDNKKFVPEGNLSISVSNQGFHIAGNNASNRSFNDGESSNNVKELESISSNNVKELESISSNKGSTDLETDSTLNNDSSDNSVNKKFTDGPIRSNTANEKIGDLNDSTSIKKTINSESDDSSYKTSNEYIGDNLSYKTSNEYNGDIASNNTFKQSDIKTPDSASINSLNNLKQDSGSSNILATNSSTNSDSSSNLISDKSINEKSIKKLASKSNTNNESSSSRHIKKSTNGKSINSNGKSTSKSNDIPTSLSAKLDPNKSKPTSSNPENKISTIKKKKSIINSVKSNSTSQVTKSNATSEKISRPSTNESDLNEVKNGNITSSNDSSDNNVNLDDKFTDEDKLKVTISEPNNVKATEDKSDQDKSDSPPKVILDPIEDDIDEKSFANSDDDTKAMNANLDDKLNHDTKNENNNATNNDNLEKLDDLGIHDLDDINGNTEKRVESVEESSTEKIQKPLLLNISDGDSDIDSFLASIVSEGSPQSTPKIKNDVDAKISDDDSKAESKPNDNDSNITDASNKTSDSIKSEAIDLKESDSTIPTNIKPSGPKPIIIDHVMNLNDAKVIQYQYAIIKTKAIISSLENIESKFTENLIPLVSYLILYTRSIFLINDKDFGLKLNKLSQFLLFNPANAVNVSTILSHIPFDVKDLVITPLEDLPVEEKAIKCLNLLRVLLKTALSGYQKRLASATKDEVLIGSAETLVKSVLSPKDFDLALNDLEFTLPPPSYRNDDVVIEASLVDMDISAMFSLIKNMKKVLKNINPLIQKYKTAPESKLPSYAFHEILVLCIRLNDLYNIFRSFGRKAYLSNLIHLNDQKFLIQAKNSTYLKMVLTKLDDLLNNNKKNGTLVATLTRYFKQNSLFEITSKNVKDFINFVSQGYNVLTTSISVVEDFMINWTLAEIKFRTTYSIPKNSLISIYNKFTEAPPSVVKPKPTPSATRPAPKTSALVTRKRKTSNASLTSPQSSVSSFESFPSVRNSLEIPELKLNRGSRSSSISSNGSNNSSYLSPLSSPQRGPVFLNAANSLSNLDLSPKVTTRRRSNSQPITGTANPALAGAAAALSSDLRSPSGSIKRTSKTSRPQSSSKNVNQLLHSAAEDQSPVRLTANQRFQQHLRAESKSGSLTTQDREVFQTVIFDPSNPSATNIRRAEKVQETEVHDEVEAQRIENNRPTMFGKPTKRDSVTRQNTKRNSVSTAGMLEEVSSSNSSISGVIKKVRFTGVPEYSEEEDMPLNYAEQILRNFPSAKIPSYKNTQVKKKDLMLKQEESFLWRNELSRT